MTHLHYTLIAPSREEDDIENTSVAVEKPYISPLRAVDLSQFKQEKVVPEEIFTPQEVVIEIPTTIEASEAPISLELNAPIAEPEPSAVFVKPLPGFSFNLNLGAEPVHVLEIPETINTPLPVPVFLLKSNNMVFGPEVVLKNANLFIEQESEPTPYNHNEVMPYENTESVENIEKSSFVANEPIIQIIQTETENLALPPQEVESAPVAGALSELTNSTSVERAEVIAFSEPSEEIGFAFGESPEESSLLPNFFTPSFDIGASVLTLDVSQETILPALINIEHSLETSENKPAVLETEPVIVEQSQNIPEVVPTVVVEKANAEIINIEPIEPINSEAVLVRDVPVEDATTKNISEEPVNINTPTVSENTATQFDASIVVNEVSYSPFAFKEVANIEAITPVSMVEETLPPISESNENLALVPIEEPVVELSIVPIDNMDNEPLTSLQLIDLPEELEKTTSLNIEIENITQEPAVVSKVETIENTVLATSETVQNQTEGRTQEVLASYNTTASNDERAIVSAPISNLSKPVPNISTVRSVEQNQPLNPSYVESSAMTTTANFFKGFSKVYRSSAKTALAPVEFLGRNAWTIAKGFLHLTVPLVMTYFLVKYVPFVATMMEQTGSRAINSLYMTSFYVAASTIWLTAWIAATGLAKGTKVAFFKLASIGQRN